VCRKISPADINLVVKCCKPLAKLLPRLGSAEEGTLTSTISWILACIACLEDHHCHSEQIDQILHFYAFTIQTCGNLNINSEKVVHCFNSLDNINLTLKIIPTFVFGIVVLLLKHFNFIYMLFLQKMF